MTENRRRQKREKEGEIKTRKIISSYQITYDFADAAFCAFAFNPLVSSPLPAFFRGIIQSTKLK